MDIKAKLESDLKDAMRAGDDTRKRTIRMALAAIKLAEIEKGGALDEAALLSIIQKEIKGRHEAIADAEKASRADLIPPNQDEIEVLKHYLPQQLTPAELQALAEQAIAELGASSPADMGKVIKALMPRVQGRAPGDQVSAMVRSLLTKPA